MAFEQFIEKKFSSAHKQVIRQANQLIDEYKAMGYSLTLRQIHYQFVARDWYENTQANYKRLGNILDAARKAGLVDWKAIIDITRSMKRISVWDGPEDILTQVEKQFKLDPWEYQPVKRHVEVWVEKDAAVGIVVPTCNALRIPYFSCRGYSSSTGLYEAAKRLAQYADEGYEVLVLYLGDHDPSGVQMTESTDEKVSLFARREIEFRRIALTLEQIKEYNPPANFVKETDSRTDWYVEKFNTTDCWELDALRPPVVDALIRSHVDPLIDKAAWDKTMEDELEHRRVLLEISSDWRRTKAAPEMLEMIRDMTSISVEEDDLDNIECDAHEYAVELDGLRNKAEELIEKHDL